MGHPDDQPPPFAYPKNQQQQQQQQPPHAPTQTIDDPPPLIPSSNQQKQQPQPQPQSYPTQASSPRSTIPPTAHQPQAFPPPLSSPEHYHHPPPAGNPQAFPPAQSEPQHIHSFPPRPPQQPAAMFQQHHNVQQQTPNFAAGGNMGGQAMPGSPYNPNGGQVNYNNNNAKPTSPYVHQTQMMPVIQSEPWKSSLFDCMNDPENAIITACCPCVTFGQIAEIVDQGQTSCGTSGLIYSVIGFCIGIPCIMSCGYRTKLRSRFSLMETPAPDWIIHCFCEWCALCQEYRELKERGYDPAIGWLGNVAKMQPQVAMTPPMHHMMGR